MRWLCLGCALLAGCGAPAVEKVGALVEERDEPVKAGADDKAPPDLRTRKTGQDWPCFLGPTGDSVSTEKGILKPWPAAGPPLVWVKEIGIGYAMPSIARGRLYLFDRIRNRARLRCLKAENAETLWTWDYPTNYRDSFGYNGGPRCCPVVDGNRVYGYGAEGLLACVRASHGKPG